MTGRYYLFGKLHDIVFTGNASSTWQAIQYGLELFKKGLVWCIGNGSQVQAWRDPWNPRPHSFCLISTQGDCHIQRLSKLLNEQGTWNIELLQSHFMQMDIDEIIKVKPSP
jgi:hypothetical protein